MKRRVLSLLMTLTLCLTSLPATALAATQSEVGEDTTALESGKEQVDMYAADAESTDEECKHEGDRTYISIDGKNQHQVICTSCGKVMNEAEDCVANSYAKGDANGHYEVCICGNQIRQSEHRLEILPTDDGKHHLQVCPYCGYLPNDAEQEEHIWDSETGECTKCKFVPVAKDSLENLYDSVTDALEAAANGNGAEYVELYSPKTDNKEIEDAVVFDQPDKTVELRMNGYTLSHYATTLQVEGGILKITGDAIINATYSSEQPSSAVVVSGGKLFFEGTLKAEGSEYDNADEKTARKPAVLVKGGEVDFQGSLDLKGGLKITSDAKLTNKLAQGTFWIDENEEGDTLSVAGSSVYTCVGDLLADGHTLVKKDNPEEYVGSAIQDKTCTVNADIMAHAHEFKPSQADDSYICDCGKTCSHTEGFTEGKCSVCGGLCSHKNVVEKDDTTGNNIMCCETCGEQMLVKIETSDETTTYGTDFKAAMNAAENGTTITLLADVELQGRAGVYGNNRTVTLNLNGHTIKGKGGWIDIGGKDDSDDKYYTPATLKIVGNGSFKTDGNMFVDLKGTLDLSEWSGGTISMISMQDNNNYKEPDNEAYQDSDREAGLIIGPKAGKIEKLSFGGWYLNAVTRTKLSGGSYGQIWVAGFGAGVQLGSLLAEGYAFQNADGTYVEYTKKLLGEYVYNLKVVKCPHEKVDEDGTCAYCGMTDIKATLDGDTYTNIDEAVTKWLSKGGQLKLYTNYVNSAFAFNNVSNPLTIDLNGYKFNEGKSMNLNGADLTIKDTAGNGKFGKLTVDDNGKLTLESGVLEELIVPDTTATISLCGGQFTAGSISVYAYKMLENGCYLLGNNTPVDPMVMPVKDTSYQIEKADITMEGEKAGEIAIGKYQVPIAATAIVGDDAIQQVNFTWYRVMEDGTTARLAENDSVDLTEGMASYDITTDGKNYETDGWQGVEKNKDYALICVVTGITKSGNKWQTAWTGYEMTILPPSLEGAKIEFMGHDDTNTFVFWPDATNNSIGANDVSMFTQVTLNGQPLKANVDYKIVDNSACAKKIGNYTLEIEGMSPNYSGTASVAWKVEPFKLNMLPVTQCSKQYDGTDALPAGAIIDDIFNSAVDGWGKIELQKGKDYEVVEAHFMTVDAGTKDYVVTVRLLNENYVFYDGTREKTWKYDDGYNTTIDVEKADAPTAEAGTLTVMNNHADNYTVDLSAMLPTLKAPMRYGDVTYTIDKIDLGSYYDAAKGGAKIENGKLILPVQNVNTEKESGVGTVTMTVSSTNFEDFILKIDVSAMNKLVPKLDGTLTLSPAEITYGDLLGAITISGTMKDGDKVVSGTFAWVDGTIRPEVGNGTYTASWTFTPADTKLYEVVNGTTEVKVNKAASTGQPNYTKITADGKTLADAGLALTGSTLSPAAGTLEWIDAAGNVLSGDTKVEANKTYKWRFTPADGNYSILTGDVELYHVDKPAIGTQVTSDDGKGAYKITASDQENGTVTYVAPTDKKVTKITIPDTVTIGGVTYKVTAIEKKAFANCKKLKTVEIGKNITTIGDKAFYKCKSLKKIVIPASVKNIGKKAFSKTSKKLVVKVPKKKYKAYKKMLIKSGMNRKAKFKKY